MATLEEAKVTPKPLAGSVKSDQTLVAGLTDGQTVSKSGPDENGARVSDSDTGGGLNGDIVVVGGGGLVVTRRVIVETEEVSVQTSLVVEGEDGVPTIRVGGDLSALIWGGCDGKVEFNNGNGISLGGDGNGSLESVSHVEKKNGCKKGKGSLAKNVENPGGKNVERPGKEDMIGKGEENEEDMEYVNEDIGGEDVEDSGGGDVEDSDGEDVEDQNLEYSVGDLVWVKLRSNYWWPGHIYDPSKASEYATKLKEKDGILVVFFGDRSFCWCSPSELKPFVENFKEMSMQSNSKSFVNAVQNALDEMGRVVELGMTCSCVPEENRIGLTRSFAVNDAVRTVLVPEGGTGKLPVPWQEPIELLASVRYLARVFSVPCMHELTVLKSLLSAFYRAKGGYSLPVYHEPQSIEGLEDKTGKDVLDTNDFSVSLEIPNQDPIGEDWLSLSSAVGRGEHLEISDDKVYQRRKKKSVSELMKEDMVTKHKTKKGGVSKDGTGSANSMSGKKRAKTNGTDKAEVYGHSGLSSSSQRKRRMKEDESSESYEVNEYKASSVENDSDGDEEDKETLVTRERKRDTFSDLENVNSEAKDGTENLSSPRERKKSKYLSPPYTIPRWRERSPSFKRLSEIESEKFAKIERMGERMTKASEEVLGSPPILKCSGETFHKNLSKELGNGSDISPSLSPQTAEQDQKDIIDSMDVNIAEMLFLVQSGAVNPLYSWDKRSLDMITGFFYAFRSSIYRNGSNYKMYHKRERGRKRKSLNSESGPTGEDKNQTVLQSPEAKSLQTKDEANEQPNSKGRKLKKAPRLSGAKKNDKEAEKDDSLAASTIHRSSGPKSPETKNEMKEPPNSSGRKLKKAPRPSGAKTDDNEAEKDASPVALIVSFPPAFALPSKEDLIKKFSKFGPLNEKETNVLYNSYCGQVVFTRSSDAEEAWSLSLKNSPFGAAKVSYRLRYPPPVASKTQKASVSCPLKKTPLNQVASRQSDDDASQVGFIRQKLQMLTSMLENCDGKISSEMKSSLEGEMKGLLEKVNTMTETT